MNDSYPTKKITLRRHIKYVVCISFLWTVFIWASYILLQKEDYKEIVQLAQNEAQANLKKGLQYIGWMANNGGIFIKELNVESDDHPNFKKVNHNDIVNQALNEGSSINMQTYLLNGTLHDSGNNYAEWEKRAFKELSSKTDTFIEINAQEKNDYLHYMLKLDTDASCFKCHDKHNTISDNIISAISTTIPLAQYEAQHRKKGRNRFFIFTCLWLSGLTGIMLSGSRISRSLKQQRETEENLLASEQRLHFLFNGSPLPYLSLTDDGQIDDVNDTWLAVLGGYNHNEIPGRPLSDFIPESYHKELELFLLHMRNHDRMTGFELGMVKKDGASFLASFHCRKLYDPRKKLPLTLCILQDITDHKTIQKKLQESEKMYRLLIENTLEGIVFIKNGLIHHFSQRVNQITGLTDKELHNKSFIELIHPADIEIVLDAYNKRIAGENFSPDLAYRIMTKEGKIKWVESRTMLIDLDGDAGTLSFINDITDRKKLEEQLFISEKMTTIASLAAGVAHEINTPLSAILQSIQVINNAVEATNQDNRQTAEECGIDLNNLHQYYQRMEIDYFMDGIRKSALNASKIINSLLEFSRPRQGDRVPTDINKLIENSLELARADYDLRKRYDILNVDVRKEFADNLPPVTCVPMEIEQVILNLLKNAVHAIADDTENENPRITVRTSQKNNMVSIEVEDNGIGMPPDIQQKIFDPFFTTKDIGIGTGLGLSVSFTIIHDKHKGSLSVDSAVGEGAKFTIILPQDFPNQHGVE